MIIMILDLNINLVMIRNEGMGIKFFFWNIKKLLELVVDLIFMEFNIIGIIY